MRILILALLSSVTVAAALPADATVLVRVNQSTQTMSVDVDGQHVYDWRVSTGRPGYDTPDGDFRPNRMDADHHSQEYDNAPMPHAIFFDLHGHAIHGSYDPVGHPAASHGCVRLDPANAAKLFSLVEAQGMANTKVEIQGDVRVALRNVKPGSKTKIARRRAIPRQPLYGQDDASQQAASYGRPYYYYAPQPEQLPQYGGQPYGYDPRF